MDDPEIDINQSVIMPRKENPCLAVDKATYSLIILESDYDENRYTILHQLTECQKANVGVRAVPKDDHDDNFIECEVCRTDYVAFCRMHPIFWEIDDWMWIDEKSESAHNKIAEKTCPKYFRIRESNIHGMGVFANIPIPKGFVFGPYLGAYHNDRKKADNGYSWEIRVGPGKKPIFIDASDPSNSNWMRFINSSTSDEQKNMRAFQFKRGIYYKVVKPIDIGEELLVYYGDDFIFHDSIHRATRKKTKLNLRNPFVKFN